MYSCPGAENLKMRLGVNGIRMLTVVLLSALGGCASGGDMFGLGAGANSGVTSPATTSSPVTDVEKHAATPSVSLRKPSAEGAISETRVVRAMARADGPQYGIQVASAGDLILGLIQHDYTAIHWSPASPKGGAVWNPILYLAVSKLKEC